MPDRHDAENEIKHLAAGKHTVFAAQGSHIAIVPFHMRPRGDLDVKMLALRLIRYSFLDEASLSLSDA